MKSAADLYNIDIERYLFAPAPRLGQREKRRWALRPAVDWFSGWFENSWQRVASYANVFSVL